MYLVESCRIRTSGARAVELFQVDGLSLLAIPQLAVDVPGQPPGMNVGDSDTELRVLRLTAEGFEPFQSLQVPGGEDAEFFRIGRRAFLATASIRRGQDPYAFGVDSQLYEWDGARFVPFQSVPGFAAKQWRHFTLADQHFLALAQGLPLAGSQPSRIYRWDGRAFEPFQEIASEQGYNWHAFRVAGHDFLAHADHLAPSVLYRWDGARFAVHQKLAEQHGRAFASFRADGEEYLLVGCILSPSRLLRWDGESFVEHAVLDGLGTREFAVLQGKGGLYVLRVNFIHGTPAAPTTALSSQLYHWQDGGLRVVEEFPTSGGTDVAVFTDDRGPLVAVSNGLSADVRFATESVIYRFIEQEHQ
ncbi:hypothetical protein OG884_11830 [Streptosporangium sp. NBC_01755]|uniref:hypothetical protein n=1 Tax=unclassified Streptosporangium TaxID=2632669 RepID=UPI002DDBFA6C|nr:MULTISPECIES: hypothetical protein [unclassified Streptosporangium]WSA26023.1 hypothetical protein OIE13_34880 [Streptosporangium sp. NBC_01810]WSD02555.1 hypothetical protein OG884_11830 [Streptosporangium sp. NBC_01755]